MCRREKVQVMFFLSSAVQIYSAWARWSRPWLTGCGSWCGQLLLLLIWLKLQTVGMLFCLPCLYRVIIWVALHSIQSSLINKGFHWWACSLDVGLFFASLFFNSKPEIDVCENPKVSAAFDVLFPSNQAICYQQWVGGQSHLQCDVLLKC